MKKLILMTILVALMAAPAMAGPTYTVQKADLLTMLELAQSPAPGAGIQIDRSITTDIASAFIGHGAQQLTGEVGFGGNIRDGVSTINGAWIEIGNSGLSLDLSSYTDYQMVASNDNNNDTWQVALMVDGVAGAYSTLVAGTSALLTFDLTGVGTVSSIGFRVRGTVDDVYHVSMSQIPAPGAMILGGIGVSFVGWLRRRRSL